MQLRNGQIVKNVIPKISTTSKGRKSNLISFFIGITFVLPIAIVVDVLQIALDLFAVGVIVNRIIDIFMAIFIGFWLLLTGTFELRSWLSLLISCIGEAIPVIDAAPFWFLDVIYIIWRSR